MNKSISEEFKEKFPGVEPSWMAEVSLLPLKDQQIIFKIVSKAIAAERKELRDKVEDIILQEEDKGLPGVSEYYSGKREGLRLILSLLKDN